LRHTYVSDTDLDFKNMTNKERKSVAHVMGNSEPTIQFNYLYKPTSEWTQEDETQIISSQETENQISNIDIDEVIQCKKRIMNIKQNVEKLNENLYLNFLIFLHNPLCVYPLNIKGATLPLTSLWKCKICESKNSIEPNKIVKENSIYKFYILDEKFGNKEYIIDTQNTKLYELLDKIDTGKVLNNYKNTQYYYKTFLDVLRCKDLFPDLPQNYSLKNLQSDIVLSSQINLSDDDINSKTKSKKNNRKKKKKTKNKK